MKLVAFICALGLLTTVALGQDNPKKNRVDIFEGARTVADIDAAEKILRSQNHTRGWVAEATTALGKIWNEKPLSPEGRAAFRVLTGPLIEPDLYHSDATELAGTYIRRTKRLPWEDYLELLRSERRPRAIAYLLADSFRAPETHFGGILDVDFIDISKAPEQVFLRPALPADAEKFFEELRTSKVPLMRVVGQRLKIGSGADKPSAKDVDALFESLEKVGDADMTGSFALPALFYVAKHSKSDDADRFERLGALAYQFLQPVKNRQKLLRLFEKERHQLSEESKKAFDRGVRRGTSLAVTADKMCSAACSIAEKADKWLDSPVLYGDRHLGDDATGFAVRALAGVFFARAAKSCPDAKVRWEKFRKSLLGSDECTVETLQKLEGPLRESRRLSKAQGRPRGVGEVFGEQFYSILMGIVATEPLGASCFKAVRESQKAADEAIAFHLEKAAKATQRFTTFDSLMTNYAYATSVLAHDGAPEAGVLDFLRNTLEKAKDPTRIPYDSSKKDEASARAAAARSVPFLLALYTRATDQRERDKLRPLLIQTLHNYTQHLPSLMVHIGRTGTHEGPDDLAPYYFYSTVPYATSALRQLITHSNDEKEVADLKRLLAEIGGSLVGYVENSGVRTETAEEPLGRPGTTRAYENPLAGLALLTAGNCGGVDNKPNLGILRTSFVELGTPKSADGKAPGKSH